MAITYAGYKTLFPKEVDRITDAVLDLLYDDYLIQIPATKNKEWVKGQSLSYARQLLADDLKGMKVGRDFDLLLEALGFEIKEARNSRNQKCRIVTL